MNGETVEVDVSDVRALVAALAIGAEWLVSGGHAPGQAGILDAADVASRNLVACLPVPEWEPSDELVERYALTFNIAVYNRDGMANGLKSLHAAGLLREDLT